MSFWLGGELSPDGVLNWTAPLWQILCAVAVAILCFAFAYWTRGTEKKYILPEMICWALALALLVFSLSGPTWMSEKGRVEKGRYVVLVDGSASMDVLDGESPRNAGVSDIIAGIKSNVDAPVDVFSFTSSLSPGLPENYDGGETDIGSALSIVTDRHLGKKLQGIALISDGIDRGMIGRLLTEFGPAKLKESLPNLPGPLTTYALGRKTDLYDAAVLSVNTGSFAYQRTPFSVTATVQGPPGESIDVGLYDGDKRVKTYRKEQFKTVKLDESGKGIVEFQVRPKSVGRFTWDVRIPISARDAAPSNNSLPFVIKVVRDKIRVLQVSGSPSYDQKFLRLFLKQDPSVELVSFFILRTEEDFGTGWADHELSLIAFPYVQLFSEELDSFDLVIFQNFNYQPYFGWDADELLSNIASFVRNGKGFVMTGGDRSFDLGEYQNTPISKILPVKLGATADPSSEVRFIPQLSSAGINHPITRLSPISNDNESYWKKLSKMDGYNKNLGLVKGAAALLHHPKAKTPNGQKMPVLAVREVDKGRVMSISMDSSWRWSFTEAVEGSGNQAYLRFWKNALRWLVADPEDRRVVINPSRENARIGQEIQISLKTRDSGYGPVEGAELTGKIIAPSGTETEINVRTGVGGEALFPFTPMERGAHVVQAQYGSDEVETVFAASDRNPELLTLLPNPELMSTLANMYDGLALNAPGKPLTDPTAQRETPQKALALLGFAPLIGVLFGLFASLAWWLRRRGGSR